MQKIKMLKTAHGSPDGIAVVHYFSGLTYVLPDDLVSAFISMGVCELVISGQLENKPPENVNLGAAPEKKAPKKGKK